MARRSDPTRPIPDVVTWRLPASRPPPAVCRRAARGRPAAATFCRPSTPQRRPGRREVLGHHPLVPFPFRRPVGGEPVLGQTAREEEALAVAEGRFQRLAADGERFTAQVTAVPVQAIEDRVARLTPALLQ